MKSACAEKKEEKKTKRTNEQKEWESVRETHRQFVSRILIWGAAALYLLSTMHPIFENTHRSVMYVCVAVLVYLGFVWRSDTHTKYNIWKPQNDIHRYWCHLQCFHSIPILTHTTHMNTKKNKNKNKIQMAYWNSFWVCVRVRMNWSAFMGCKIAKNFFSQWT